MEYVAYPRLYRASDNASLLAQRRYLALRKVGLVLLIIGAIVGSISPSPLIAVFRALIVAFVLIIGIVLEWYIRAKNYEKLWFDCRAVAESVKTATWRYVMRAQPYNTNSAIDKNFIDELREIEGARRDIHSFIAECPAGGAEISDKMREMRQATLTERKAFYLTNRLQEQKTWYEIKAKFNSDKQLAWSRMTIIIQVVAILAALLLIRYPILPLNPIAPLIAGSAVSIAWAQIKRFNELGSAYSLAAQELSSIESLMLPCNNEIEFLELVIDAEGAISREHTMWYAKRL